MKRSLLAGLLLFSTLPALAEDAPPGSIQDYLNPAANDYNGLSDTVWQMLNDAGQTVGFQGGKAQRAWELRQILTERDSAQFATSDRSSAARAICRR